TIPKTYGGAGQEPDILKARIIAEEFARAQVASGMGGGGISFLVPVLLDRGSEEMKQRFIPPTIRGEMLWCQGYSEPNAGSDLASLTTRAALDGDEWIINGQKIWTSGAKTSDWMFALVRTEPDEPKHHGISFLLLPTDTPGVDIRPLKTMTGESFFNEVFFTDARVPKGQILGQRGEGWAIANAILRHERDSLGDPDVSLRRLNALTELMQNESVDGERLIDNAAYRDRLMQIQGRIMALRFNDLRLLSATLNKRDVPLATIIVKVLGTRLRHDLEALAIDALGELGLLYEEAPYVRDHGSWQHNFMEFLGLMIGGGTTQIQKNIISERGLGMPREPRHA
ncbi:MAG: acyl-CoA dehydrogenase family protein, partial [Candidatus Hydrogenedentes bacterium]|nr:acyl-CoA dehydrogenase family protein [Candidatus Hydrogenedentota bacterium]